MKDKHMGSSISPQEAIDQLQSQIGALNEAISAAFACNSIIFRALIDNGMIDQQRLVDVLRKIEGTGPTSSAILNNLADEFDVTSEARPVPQLSHLRLVQPESSDPDPS